MAGRRTNLALLIALAVAWTTGGIAFGLGSGWNRWPTVAHGVAGLAVALLSPWKSVVSRRGLARRGVGGGAPSLLLAALTVVALLTALVHTFGGRTLGPVTAMQVHVGAALVALPLASWHVVARQTRPSTTDLSRRNALRLGVVAGGAAAAWAGVQVVGADRRSTGSLETGSGRPAAMPVTQWLFDEVPAIDVPSWRIDVGGRRWSATDVAAVGDEVEAVLDCTGGWWATQVWGGARLGALLGDLDGAASIVVRSDTGYERRFPARDVDALLLATSVAGAPLSPGHGAPARLVCPGRRGFWWVKWVTEISLSDRPWWWQPPFPPT